VKPIGTFAGAEIALDYTDGVTIVLRWRLGDANQAVIRGLGEVLGGFAWISSEGMEGRAEIRYSDGLDRRLVALTDLLIAVRYGHPKMMQLPLALTDEEAQQVAEVMGA